MCPFYGQTGNSKVNFGVCTNTTLYFVLNVQHLSKAYYNIELYFPELYFRVGFYCWFPTACTVLWSSMYCISCIFCQKSFNVLGRWGLFRIPEFGLGTEMRLVFCLECLVTTPRFLLDDGNFQPAMLVYRKDMKLWNDLDKFKTIKTNIATKKITLNQSLKQTIWLNLYMFIIFIPFTKPH